MNSETTLTVFRCGSMYRSAHRFNVVESNEYFDEFKPDGRAGRTEAIFASPDLQCLETWIPIKNRRKESRSDWSSIFNVYDHDVEIRHIDVVDSDSIYVYDSMEWWETHQKFCGHPSERGGADPSRYWNSGILLEEWLRTKHLRTVDQNMNSEILLAPRNIGQVRIATLGGVVELYVPQDTSNIGDSPSRRKTRSNSLV